MGMTSVRLGYGMCSMARILSTCLAHNVREGPLATIRHQAELPSSLVEAVADLLPHHGCPFVPDERLQMLETLLAVFLQALPTGDLAEVERAEELSRSLNEIFSRIQYRG